MDAQTLALYLGCEVQIHDQRTGTLINPEALDKTNLGLPIGFIEANALYAVPEGLFVSDNGILTFEQ